MKTRLTPWRQDPEHRALLTSGTHCHCCNHGEPRRGSVVGDRRCGCRLSEGQNSVTVHSSDKRQRELHQEEESLNVRGSKGTMEAQGEPGWKVQSQAMADSAVRPRVEAGDRGRGRRSGVSRHRVVWFAHFL